MKREFFERNRVKLFNALENNSAVILLAGPEVFRSEDANYDFKPNRNFFYMTGVDEPKDIYFAIKKDNKFEEFLLISRFDPAKSRWVGKTFDEKEIYEKGGIKQTYFLDELNKVLEEKILNKNLKIFMDFHKLVDSEIHLPSKDFKEKYLKDYEVNDIYETIATFRLYKEQEEIEELRRAIHITNIALKEVKKALKPNMNERELDALFAYHIFKNGASDFAFPTIAASGMHSCTLHYVANNDITHDNDVMLFDLGAACSYYSADISRTYPVNGKFNKRQQQIYDIVKDAQRYIISVARPGLTTKILNDMLIEHYTKVLTDIGLIKNKEELSKYYFHGVSHHLGLDTHDVCSLNTRDIELKEGCIITVEPGLYIIEEKIGVRIEDDVLITKDGCIVLSEEIDK